MATNRSAAESELESEEYVLNECPEKTVGQNTVWARQLQAFPALQNPNYRIYFLGQLVSVVGTWLQIVAEGWLVLHLTNSPFLIGLVAACATVPSLLLSLFGGVMVDRFPKKTILFFTQSTSMVLAFIFGTLAILELATVPVICLLAFLLGTVNAVDAPARQAFISEMGNNDQLPSAIALNSGIFNAGRVIGPGLAGMLIAIVGTGGAFIANGISYLGVIIALTFLRIPNAPPGPRVHPIRAIKDGIRFSFDHPLIRTLLVFTAVTSIFGWSYTTMMPVIASHTFQVDAKGLGYLYSATGVGALVATYLVGAYAKKLPPVVFIIGGNSLFCLSLLVFAFTTHFESALVLLFLIGLGLLCQSAMMNTVIQGSVKNEYRGRVMSLYILMFLGLAPVGNFEIGWLTEHLGISWAITINASVVLVFGMSLLLSYRKIRAAYEEYKELHQDEILV